MRRSLPVLALACCLAAPASAAPSEAGTVSWFDRLPEAALAEFIVECRDDVRRAEGRSCRNAEVSFSRRYAEALRRRRLGHLRSPLWWAENRHTAANAARICNSAGPDPAGLRAYCRYIPAGIMRGT